MKRHILLLLFVLIGINAMAQEFSAGDIGKKPIDIYGSKVYMDNCKLDKNDAAACFSSIDGVDMSKEYLKYRERGFSPCRIRQDWSQEVLFYLRQDFEREQKLTVAEQEHSAVQLLLQDG